MEADSRGGLSVAVYAPLIQGFYFGELIAQIQQLCVVKSYRFTLIKTRSFGEYQSKLGTGQFDIVISLRNAVHPDLVEYLRAAGKAVVSLAFDYFPLDVPVVSPDNEYGLELAFNHLIKHGHQKLAFAGDISQFDLRKRYEAFCDQHEINGFPLEDDQIFILDNALPSSGYSLAKEFVARDNGATGIICGAGLTAVGFARKLTQLNPSLLEKIDIVAFDALSVFPFSTSGISIVDQNMFLLAHKTLELGEKLFQREIIERHTLVQPKLVAADSDLYVSGDAFLATSAELAEIHNANYVKSLLANFYEWPKEIGEGRLEDLMMLEPFFPRHLQEALLTRVVKNSSAGPVAKVVRHFTLDGTEHLGKEDKQGLCLLADYPKGFKSFNPAKYTSVIHIPICSQENLWGILSVFGESEQSSAPSSISSLCGYLGLTVKFLEKQLRSNKLSVKGEQEKTQQSQSQHMGQVVWNISDSTAQWDSKAMEMLGYIGELDRHVYQHMELGDLVHKEDERRMRALIDRASTEETTTSIRLRHKNKSYPTYDITCRKEPGKEELRFDILLSHEDHG
ncbi:DNA-binding transcriptional regulator, LacI/PurR family [Alteromonadaceae bacterium Bs31]|nr:DNA-binding transcriptional regulator, LacI/PurR family [Alteromonadaceae bacterium Bs31]